MWINDLTLQKNSIIDPLELFAKILWAIDYSHFWCLTGFSNYAYKTRHKNLPIRPSFIIFPINLNFSIMSRCVLKAIIHRKKQWIILQLLEISLIFQKYIFYDSVHAFCTWLIFPFHHSPFLNFFKFSQVFLFAIYLLFKYM